MKLSTRYFWRLLFAGSCSVLLAFATGARADDNEQGGSIEGTESLDVEIMMTPTAAAPPGSSIQLSLESEDDDGTTSATLNLETTLLPAATYSVSATLKSNGSTVALGTFTTDGSDAEVEFGTSEGMAFPPGFNPFDIATVSVSNAGNVVLFTADLTSIASVTSEALNASLTGTAGQTAPSATAAATLSAQAASGVASGSLVVTAHGLPARSKLAVTINGTPSKKVVADSLGNATVTFLPKAKTGAIARGVSIFGVRNVQVKDAAGNVLLNTSF